MQECLPLYPHAAPTGRHLLKCLSGFVCLTSVLTANLSAFDAVWWVVRIQCKLYDYNFCSHWWQYLPFVVVFLFTNHQLFLNVYLDGKKENILCDNVIKNPPFRVCVSVHACMKRDRKRQGRNRDADRWKEFSFVVWIIYLFHSEVSHSLFTLSVCSQGPGLWYHLGWRGSNPL